MGCCASDAVEYKELLEFCEAPGISFVEEVQEINGTRHNVVRWLPDESSGEVKAVVVIAHGLAEHSLRYHRFAHGLVAAGYGVFMMDHVSHGKSEGRSGLIRNGQQLYLDFSAYCDWVHEQHKSLPLFVMGHSMGGLIAVMSVNRVQRCDAAIFSAAAVVSGPSASSPFGIRCLYPLSQTSFAYYLTSVTATIAPRAPLAPLLPLELTSDPDELELLRCDPRCAKPTICNKTGFELLKVINEVKAEVPQIKIPFLCIHGTEDTITLPEGSEYIYRNASSDITQRELHMVQGAKHDIFHESASITDASIEYVVKYIEKQYHRHINNVDHQSDKLGPARSLTPVGSVTDDAVEVDGLDGHPPSALEQQMDTSVECIQPKTLSPDDINPLLPQPVDSPET